MNRPPLAYRLASLGLALPLAVHTVVRAARDGGRSFLTGRYGFAPRLASRPVWVHCASVGEVAAAAPLLRELAAHVPGPLLVSTVTPTGQARARALAPAGSIIAYLPVDRPGPVRRFLARTRPRAALVLETELWPHLFAALTDRDVPIAIVNGRLSPRTLAAPAWWQRTAAWCLHRVTRVLARSETDRERFAALGMADERLHVVGNIKLAAAPAGAADAIELGAPSVLAASTHDDEELQLARAWRAGGPADRLLVIAPRHPERGATIAAALAAEGFEVRRRSRDEPPGATGSVYLADTLGELGGLIAAADVVVMGGSLIARGGQNVLEPARAGRAIVTGPHMHNFADETERLAAAGALQQCPDAASIVAAVNDLLADPGARAAAGEAGRALLAAEADMAARYRRALLEALPVLAPADAACPPDQGPS